VNANLTSRCARYLIFPLIAWAGLATRAATNTAPPGQATPVDPGWPRQYTDGTAKLVLYQPQVDNWKDFRRLQGRFAAALTPAKGGHTIYGALRIEADTFVDTESRTVAVTNFTIADAHFAGVKDEAEAQNLSALVSKLFPKQPTSVSLDRVLAYMDTGQIKPRETAVSLDPPAILVSTQPALLVIIDGDPVLFDLENTNLQKVVNTNWDLFFDKKQERYYLRNNTNWYSAKNLTDAWKVEKKSLKEFSKLPATESFAEVRRTAASPQPPPTISLVLVVNKPTELVVINGPPDLRPVSGTQLSWVANTECDLFFSTVDRYYYFLTSGRWFRSQQLGGGTWQPATTTLPDDFKKIPTDHPRAHVLAAVPGTRQAEDAVLAASIPQTATIDRKTAKAEVQYIGDPKFEPIAGTNISYATNTPSDVLKLGDQYYFCLQGVWFVSTSATGPWVTADKVPEEIYSIPPQSPKYNVTYVTVADSTPDTVTYSYMAGYTGVYVGYGVAMWGTGYYYPPYYGWGYYPYPVYWPAAYYTYGASAWYNPATGAYARGSAVYGPYGGYGRAAAYSPATGRYSWGQAAWGPYGAAASGGFYNPNTGRWGGTYRASNGYQSWGQSVVGRGNQWARTGSYSDSRGTVAGIKTSSGGSAIAARGSQSQGFAARSATGDVYAGRDGNVYKRDQSNGQWYKNNGGSWENVNRPNAGAQRTGTAGSANAQAIQGLNHDAAARSRGNYNTQRSHPSSAGYGGARMGGFSGRGGFRRR
jgi:hypothetical protein